MLDDFCRIINEKSWKFCLILLKRLITLHPILGNERGLIPVDKM